VQRKKERMLRLADL
jgi:hypothetical protein